MPRIKLTPKQRGEVAELAFMRKAASLGLVVCRPYGDSARLDCVVLDGRKTSRVQIKFVGGMVPAGYYYLHLTRGGSGRSPRRYSTRQVDFVAVHVGPTDSWYIFPPSVFTRKCALLLYPSSDSRVYGRYDQYLERWDLFFERLPSGFTIHASTGMGASLSDETSHLISSRSFGLRPARPPSAEWNGPSSAPTRH